MGKNNFKLLAIRPLNNCDKRFLKNLSKGTIYKFYNEYIFKDSNDNEITGSLEEVCSVTHSSKVPTDFYQIENKGNTIDVNISALVGKNGSGKSSLLELLYATCFRIASRKRLLDGNEHGLLITHYGPLDAVEQRESHSKLSEIKRLITSINVEIFYSINECVYCINVSNNEINHKLIEGKDKLFSGWLSKVPLDKHLKYIFNDVFFYTISVNYSLYGLNNNILGGWINELFHKNDGYQTPLVINPFRTDGNIDVNSELHLAQTRFFTNSIHTIENSKVNNKEVGLVNFKLELSKSYVIEGVYIYSYFESFKTKLNLSDKGFICYLYNKFYDLNLIENDIYTPLSGSFGQQLNYIFYKILKISIKYKEYKKYEILRKHDVNLDELDGFLSVLCKDKSHITLKLRQTLNNLRFNLFKIEEGANMLNFDIDSDFDDEEDSISEFNFSIQLPNLINLIKYIKGKNDFLKYEELIPLGCHSITLYMINDKQKPSDLTDLVELSSGEQHFIFSIQSILYHLINVNSVFESKSEKIKYKYVNIILDEIELYFHPEFQRIFVYELLKRIQTLSIPNIESINILFCTHSPFILSDIPKENTLKLDNGEIISDVNSRNTLGANIHDLLDNEFYLSKGFMGEFIKDKIFSLIGFLNVEDNDKYKSIFNYEWDKEKAFDLIELIGEPILKGTLKELYFNIYTDDIDTEIQRLKNLKKSRQNDFNR